MVDLLNRLRTVDPPGGNEHSTRWHRNPDGPEAADLIERMQEELTDATEILGYRDRDIEKFRKGTLAFTAEVERLREAGLACADRVGDLLREAREREEKHHKEIERLQARVQEFEAARIAYASEFDDDVGSIHENIRKMKARVRELEAAVDAVRNLISNSEGVAGLHLNGDVAPWDELMEGGEYEAWLGALAAVSAETEARYLPDAVLARRLDEARAAVSAEKEES